MSPRTVVLCLTLAACSSSSAPRGATPTTAPVLAAPADVPSSASGAEGDAAPPAVADAAEVSAGDASAPGAAADVPANASDSNEIVVSGGSDLPAGEGTTASPFSAAVERALAPLAATLTECMRPVIPRQRRLFRVLVRADGRIVERSPQSFAMSLRVRDCLHQALTPVRVSPPPREIPYDIAVEPAQDRPYTPRPQ